MADSTLQHVNVFQGTQNSEQISRGNTLPLTCLPFSNARWAPESVNNPGEKFSGMHWFHPSRKHIKGIRLTHQPSPWMGDYASATVSFWSKNDEVNLSSQTPTNIRLTHKESNSTMKFVPSQTGGIFVVQSAKPGAVTISITVPYHEHSTLSFDASRNTLLGVSSHAPGGALMANGFGVKLAMMLKTGTLKHLEILNNHEDGTTSTHNPAKETQEYSPEVRHKDTSSDYSVFPAGFEADGTPLYVSRCWYKGNCRVGKASRNFRGANFPFEGRELCAHHAYEILVLLHETGSVAQTGFDWVTAKHGDSIPPNAIRVASGHQASSQCFVGRVDCGGGKHPGKVKVEVVDNNIILGSCNLSYGGGEVSVDTYQLLVSTSSLSSVKWIPAEFGEVPSIISSVNSTLTRLPDGKMVGCEAHCTELHFNCVSDIVAPQAFRVQLVPQNHDVVSMDCWVRVSRDTKVPENAVMVGSDDVTERNIHELGVYLALICDTKEIYPVQYTDGVWKRRGNLQAITDTFDLLVHPKGCRVMFSSGIEGTGDDRMQWPNNETSSNHASKITSLQCELQVEPNTQGIVRLDAWTSFISHEQAFQNRSLELCETLSNTPDKDDITTVDHLERKAIHEWESRLGRIRINDPSATSNDLATFYSCLYRCHLFPRQLHERMEDGTCRYWSPYNGELCDGKAFTDQGFWDVHRTLFPLLSLLYPVLYGDIVAGYCAAVSQIGWFPKWASPGYRSCMVGTHIDNVIADAAVKGIDNFDLELAFKGMEKHANSVGDPGGVYGRIGIESYMQLGYVPSDKHPYSVSRTLDFSMNDFGIAQVARKLGKSPEVVDKYLKRSENYRNVFEPNSGTARPRRSNGDWDTDFDELAWGGSYVEGGMWHSTWGVPHNVEGLAECMGGKDQLCSQLDKMLAMEPKFKVGSYGYEIHEMREMASYDGLGQFNIGNQPQHHCLHLYAAVGKPERTRELVNRVVGDVSLFDASPAGFPGDEDNGEMSAWFVFGCIGIYPLCPGVPEYVLSSPKFSNIQITVGHPDGEESQLHITSASTVPSDVKGACVGRWGSGQFKECKNGVVQHRELVTKSDSHLQFIV